MCNANTQHYITISDRFGCEMQYILIMTFISLLNYRFAIAELS